MNKVFDPYDSTAHQPNPYSPPACVADEVTLSNWPIVVTCAVSMLLLAGYVFSAFMFFMNARNDAIANSNLPPLLRHATGKVAFQSGVFGVSCLICAVIVVLAMTYAFRRKFVSSWCLMIATMMIYVGLAIALAPK